MKNQIVHVLVCGLFYALFSAWTANTVTGRRLRHFLQNWRTDWFHGVMVSISVFILACCAILALALTFSAVGI